MMEITRGAEISSWMLATDTSSEGSSGIVFWHRISLDGLCPSPADIHYQLARDWIGASSLSHKINTQASIFAEHT